MTRNKHCSHPCMIIELYKYLTNPATPSAKKMGQLKETIAMEARYHRSKKQWESHLVNSQNTIKKAIISIEKKRDVIILGSGLLLDIPIDYLCEKFERVFLVDVIHLKKIRRKVKKWPNAVLIEHDVTGLSEQMLKANASEGFLFSQSASIPQLSSRTDLVVSANMLSQLHLAPIYYAEKIFHFNERKLEELTHNIMQDHITMLKSTKSKVCLISDFERIYKNNKQEIYDTEKILIGINLPNPNEKWYWEIAPVGEIDKKSSMTSHVYAYSDFS